MRGRRLRGAVPIGMLGILLAIAAIARAGDPVPEEPEPERRAGFLPIFDGETLAGWKAFGGAALPESWRVAEGVLHCDGAGAGHDLATVATWGDFELRLEWSVDPGGNSGVFYRAIDGVQWSGPEMQILDDAGHPDGAIATHRAGACYDLHAPAQDAVRPAPEWNAARLVVRGASVEHWLNGVRVVAYELGSTAWRERVAASKYRDVAAYGRAPRGHLVLQDHGEGVRFRNLRIRSLDAPAVAPLSTRTLAETGRTRMIPFTADRAAMQDLVLPVAIDDAEVLAIAAPAILPAGGRLGFVRVRGLREGTTRLAIGDSAIEVRVVAPRAPRSEDAPPRIVGPANGAAAWGAIDVGVALRLGDDAALDRVVLEIDGATRLEPVADTGSSMQPDRRLRFRFDAAGRAAGPATLVPIALDDSGSARRGAPVVVDVVHPAAVHAVEAEARQDGPRPERFADDRASIGRDRAASGGAYFLNASAQPALCVPVAIEEAGRYQVILVAGGRGAGGALPTVGLVVDGEERSRTNAPLLDERFHRLVLGTPVALEAGRRMLTPLFANDFYVAGRADRNLFIDRIEIARIDAGTAPEGDGSGMGMSMAGGMAGSMAGGSGAAAAIDDPLGLRAAPLRVGFEAPLDGLPIGGVLEVRGRAWWAGLEERPAPVVELHVNGRAIDAQRSAAPRFWIDPASFAPGENEIMLLARSDDGATARTAVQRLHFAPEAHAERGAARRHRRYAIHEERWDEETRRRLTPMHYPDERRSAGFGSNGAITLTLPDDLAGEHELFLELRGDDFEGAAVATLRLRRESGTIEVGAIEAPSWWDLRRVGTIDLAPGPKALEVAFANDRYEEGVGDRNLYVQAAILAERPGAEDRAAPHVAIEWPRDGTRAWRHDAVVARVADGSGVVRVEVLIDGVATGVGADLTLRPGLAVLPLPLLGVEPGPHEVSLRATDRAGNVGASEGRRIEVLAEAPEAPTDVARARRLLDRFGYGPDPRELRALLALGPEAWLVDRLHRGVDDPAERAAIEAALPHWPGQGPYEVAHRAIAHLLLTPNPARTRFVHWAQNRFSTWIRKTEGPAKWQEHAAFLELGVAPFPDLLLASAESPAMLVYLDQAVSYADRLNENYAREIMELHALGVDDGYVQADVEALARILAGWTVAYEGDGIGGGPEAIVRHHGYDAALADGAALRFLGRPFAETASDARWDRARMALEMLAAHPAAARHAARGLVAQWYGPGWTDAGALLAALERVYHEEAGDLAAMLVLLALRPEATAPPDRAASAIDYAVRLDRATGARSAWRVNTFLAAAGRGIFDRPTPDGWPEEDAARLDSNAMLQRWRLASDAPWRLAALVPGAWVWDATIDDAEFLDRAIDCLAYGLVGRPLDARSEAAVRAAWPELEGRRDARLRALAVLVARMPEMNLR